MVEIPLILRLRRQVHKDLARAQDIIVREMYNVFQDAVLHGGTAIWRCYNGTRFSEDIDVYLMRDVEKIDEFFNNLTKRGFNLKKKKIGRASIYAKLQLDRTVTSFEAVFKKTKAHLKEFETIDGNFITVFTLLPEEFIEEKVNAYINRRKIRDLYDIFFLLRHAEESKKIKLHLKKLMGRYREPLDESDLKILIYEGLAPSSEQMLEYIRRF